MGWSGLARTSRLIDHEALHIWMKNRTHFIARLAALVRKPRERRGPEVQINRTMRVVHQAFEGRLVSDFLLIVDDVATIQLVAPLSMKL